MAWSGESLEVQNQVCKVFKFGLLVSDSVRMEHVIDGWMDGEGGHGGVSWRLVLETRQLVFSSSPI